MADDWAQTYLRLLAESEVRRAVRRPGPGGGPDLARSVSQVRWAGEILITVGLLDERDVNGVAHELEAALLTRSDMDRSRYASRVNSLFARLADRPRAWPPPRWWGTAQPMQITPVGRVISVAHDRAPSDLHLMTLVRSPGGAAITAAMRMRWPPDGSAAEEEIGGAGPQHLPYDQLWALDDRGTRYRVLMGGEGGPLTWLGAIGLDGPPPPPEARWLDLIADGTHRLVRIDLAQQEAAAEPVSIEPVSIESVSIEPVGAAPPGERLLAAAAEAILASAWDSDGPCGDARLGETITVLAAAGAIAADSPTPGHLAALCQRLGVPGPAVTAPAATRIPDRWAEILPPSHAGPPGPGSEWFAPLGTVTAVLDDTRFAFAGLTSAGGQSFLHVVATGMQPAYRWDTGFSWWVRDDAGRWHLALETDPHAREVPAEATGVAAFRLRLTPPLRTRPGAIEVVVTGRVRRARAVVPVGQEMPDT